MNQVEPRRIVPVSLITLILFGLMAVFQFFVIGGGYELEASTVKKNAPWAYESFLKMVGEHPDTRPEWAAHNKTQDKVERADAIKIGGFSPEAIPVTIDVEPLPESSGIIEPTKPQAEPETIIPVSVPEEESDPEPGKAVPVG
jgi:hypothetical protein